MTCLSQHAQEFDYASIAVVGEKQGLASRALILGLKDYFCSLDIRQIDRQFDFDAINRAVKLRT